jgi:hypothetical protein
MSESATEAYASVERSSKSGFDRHDFDNLGAGTAIRRENRISSFAKGLGRLAGTSAAGVAGSLPLCG